MRRDELRQLQTEREEWISLLVEDIKRYFNADTPQDEYDALAAMDRFIATLQSKEGTNE